MVYYVPNERDRMSRQTVHPDQRFSRWSVIEEAAPARRSNGKPLRMIRCRCECGAERTIQLQHLNSGASVSCGCYRDEVSTQRMTRHGHKADGKTSRAYQIWRGIITRCHDAGHRTFQTYGARGILVCERWRGSFENFLADMGDPPEGMTLERERNGGNYEPGNCKWATPIEQANNTRRNVYVMDGDERVTLAQLARRYGVPYDALHDRVQDKGQPAHEAIKALQVISE